jgi:tetratricopeptide (TPR) repeat protein
MPEPTGAAEPTQREAAPPDAVAAGDRQELALPCVDDRSPNSGRARSKTLLTIGATIFVSIITFGSIWLHSRALDGKRTAFGLRFDARIERVETTLRQAHSLPLHDLSPIRSVVEHIKTGIAQEMSEGGRAAQAPGHAAIGRACLALDDYEGAREHLQKAWRLGTHTPTVAFGLGVTLDRLYRRELAAVARIRNGPDQVAKRRELIVAYRDPALDYLRHAVGDCVDESYATALIAALEERVTDAHAAARATLANAPWLFEARLIEGDVNQLLAARLRNEGRPVEALEHIRAADEAYRAAAEIGRSSPRVHDARCQLWQGLLHDEVWTRDSGQEATVQTAVRACQDALVVAPANTSALSNLADTYVVWADHLMSVGADPQAPLESAIAAAERALALKPKGLLALSELGYAHWLLGKWQLRKGQDPHSALEQALGYTRRVVEGSPRDPRAFNALGLIMLDRASDQANRGHDTASTLQQAIDAFQASRFLSPREPEYLLNLGMAYGALLRREVATGAGDPGTTAARAFEALRAAAELKPGSAKVEAAIAALQVTLASWETGRAVQR